MDQKEKDLAAAYEGSLVIPAERPAFLSLLCPVGLVGSGKTTVVKPLAEKLSFVRVSSDELRKLFKENGLGYERVFEAAAGIVERCLKAGYSVAIDGDCASPHSRELIRRACKELGARAIWVHVNPPESFILKKLREYKHTWLFKDADQAIQNYKDRKALHEGLDMPFVYKFDTSRADLGLQINEAADIIQRETAAAS